MKQVKRRNEDIGCERSIKLKELPWSSNKEPGPPTRSGDVDRRFLWRISQLRKVEISAPITTREACTSSSSSLAAAAF